VHLFDGDKRVWWVGGAVLGAILIAMLVALLQPGERYTGSNSVGVRSEVAVVKAGRTLCAPGLEVPHGTAQVRFAAHWQGYRRPGFRVELRTPSRVLRGLVPGGIELAPPLTTSRIDVDIPEVASEEDEPLPGRLCITPVHVKAAVGGVFGLQGDQRPATLAGKALDGRVAVWFLPAEKSSFLARFPEALSRAALFRPGVVEPWWYVVLLMVVMPCLWLAALRLLATRAAGTARGARTAVVVGVLAFASASSWALITPAWQGPDEPDHFAFTQALAERGETPDKQPSRKPPFSSREVFALEATRVYSQVGLPDAKPPWLDRDERRWKQRLERQSTRQDDGGGLLISASPHGAGYYGLTVPAYLAVSGQSTFSQLTAERLVSALLAALTAAFAFLTVRELAPRQEWLAVASGLLVAFHPQFAFMGGVVNNDSGVNAAAALLVYLLVRGLRRGLTVRSGLGIAAAVVAVHITKGTGAALWPAAIVGLAGMLWRRHSRADAPGYLALAGGVAVMQGLWALLANALGSKATTTVGGAAGVGGTVDRAFADVGGYVSYLWQLFLPPLSFMTDVHLDYWPAYDVYTVGGWAAFGWLSVRFPEWVYTVIAAVSLTVAVLCVVTVSWRERLAAWSRGWELAVLLTALVSVLAGVSAAYFTTAPRTVPAEQGRYLFTAIVPFAAIVAGATLAFGRRLAPVLAAALVAAVIGLDYASQFLSLDRFFS
jgi:hypothetical protein